MVKWSSCSPSVKEFKAKDGPVSSYRTLINPGVRAHPNQREIAGKGLKVEGNPAIDRSERSKDRRWARFSKAPLRNSSHR